jgi:pimeloyl-ACP methyl ester carboxylesterase
MITLLLLVIISFPFSTLEIKQSAQSPQQLAVQKPIAGIWLGVLEVSAFKLRLALKVTQSADGKLTATFDSIDQAAHNLPIETITYVGGVVRFQAPKFSISYEGKMNEAGTEIVGEFKQGAATYPLTLKRTDTTPGLSRPQDPKKPYPYSEEDVSYENPSDKVKLTGSLTVPASKEKVPAVVLITGSGAQDRNETILGHRPFLVLADHLTRQGIAVLRVDDRGTGGSGAGSAKDTSETFAEDTLAGVAFLKTRKEIDPQRIGLLGHSEGGIIAPMAAIKSKDIAFIVMMAGIGQTGRDVILMQGDLMTKVGGTPPETTAQIRKVYEQIFSILKAEPDNAVAEKKIREVVSKETAAMTEAQKKAFAPVAKQIEGQMGMYVSPWFRFLLEFDPAKTLEKVTIPVLAIVGEKDLQVPPKENLSLIEAALKKAGNKNYTIMLMPGLNHLFQTAKTGLPTEYGVIEETISPAALKAISDWILTTVRKQ